MAGMNFCVKDLPGPPQLLVVNNGCALGIVRYTKLHIERVGLVVTHQIRILEVLDSNLGYSDCSFNVSQPLARLSLFESYIQGDGGSIPRKGFHLCVYSEDTGTAFPSWVKRTERETCSAYISSWQGAQILGFLYGRFLVRIPAARLTVVTELLIGLCHYLKATVGCTWTNASFQIHSNSSAVLPC